MPELDRQLRWLADTLRAQPWEPAALAQRLEVLLPLAPGGAAELAMRILSRLAERPARVDPIQRLLASEPVVISALTHDPLLGPFLDPPRMDAAPMGSSRVSEGQALQPPLILENWRDVGVWLGVPVARLRSLARPWPASDQRNLHYRYRWLAKPSGGWRLLEIPKPRLMQAQRKLVRDVLNRLPPHGCAHGFCRGRSVKTFVAPHVGRPALLRLDLQEFFSSVAVGRVYGLFRRLGYPTGVVRLLTGLCTHEVVPELAGERFTELGHETRQRLKAAHLPQGAPTSAPLANLCLWRLDCRLQGLAERFGLAYTRYADDLAFSGARRLRGRWRFVEACVGSIVLEEGFALNHKKTRFRLRSQRQALAGMVLNEKANCRRADWDTLKATLHNCVVYGPASQNRHDHPDFRAHLAGRLAQLRWVAPDRAAKLQPLWDRIVWS